MKSQTLRRPRATSGRTFSTVCALILGLLMSAWPRERVLGATIEPLPTSTFVFLRYVRTGAGWTYQLWSYDVLSRTERLLSKLDDVLLANKGHVGVGLDVSPDRRWVAFSAYFRPSAAEDRSLGPHTKMIWKVSADGKQFVRVTPPLADPRLPCNVGCPGFMTCEKSSQRCVSLIWSYGYESPAWSSDGRSLLFTLEQLTCDAGTCINTPITTLNSAIGPPKPPPSASVMTWPMSAADPAEGKVRRLRLPKLSPTCNIYSPIVSPDGKRLATLLGARCRVAGSVLLTDLDGNNTQLLDFDKPACSQIAWSFDGAGVYCLAHRHHQVFLYLIAEKRVQMLALPRDDKFDLESFAESQEGKGRWFVVALTSKQDKRTDLYLYDEANPKVWKRLTSNRASFRPAF